MRLDEQLIEKHAERVHVGRRGRGLAAHLLWRGVGRCPCLAAGPRQPGVVRPVGIDKFGDAEVEQLHLSSVSTRTFEGFRSR